MKTRIQKWGNSLALRIPKSFAAESHLEQGMLVDVSLLDGKLLVTPLRPPAVTLEALLRASHRRTSITKSTQEPRWGMKHGRTSRRVCPAHGEAVWISLHPQAGHEQAGRRPAVVLSPATYNGRVGLAVFCPITNQRKGYPF